MFLEPYQTERQLLDRFLEALRELPDFHADLSHQELPALKGGSPLDALIVLRTEDQTFGLLVEVKKTVYPRDVRQIIWQLLDARRQSLPGAFANEPVPVLVAESISPGAKELLRTQRVGYYDSGGSLFLPARGLYLYVEKPPPKTLAKSIRSLFSGRRAQVLHALLVQPQTWFGGKELAEQALVSQATASQVLTELERFDWVASRGQGPSKERQLKEPTALLDGWAKQIASQHAPTLRRYYVPSLKADALLERISRTFASHGVEYAVSHEAAAQRYAPFLSSVSQVRCRVLMGGAVEFSIDEIGARPVSEGANFAILEARSPGELLFREQNRGIFLASPIQVYLDLLRGEGRAKEMAAHLRQHRIGF